MQPSTSGIEDATHPESVPVRPHSTSDRPRPDPTEGRLFRPAVRLPAGRSEHNRSLRQRGQRRLNDLIDAAERDNLYGTVGIELTFERGRIVLVRFTANHTDRP